MSGIKDLYKAITLTFRRFRAWQHHPFNNENQSGGRQLHCVNCGTTFADNYCPRCGQKASTGRLTWENVKESVMNVWGVGNRSMPYSLLQLLGRPGYFIHDYLSGKRQVSYPPFRMLLIVAVVYMIVRKLMGSPEIAASAQAEKDFLLIDLFTTWCLNNPGWGMIVICCLFILPTWMFFRFSPRYPKHTLPEGFYIQVFMSSIVLVVVALTGGLTTAWSGWLFVGCYYVAYCQLFGYGLWGTLWRLALTLCEGIFMMLNIVIAYEYYVTKAPNNSKDTLAQEMLIS
ncbi:MAG: DUF3667 domain-containing protein [Prevotella sp.]|nr:DUF3667 domain-containing protein [Prevotella sp.]